MKTTERAERVATLISLVNIRELATTETQYDALTEMIEEAVDRLDFEWRPYDRLAPDIAEAGAVAKVLSPWARIMEKVLDDIANGVFSGPFKFGKGDEPNALFIRTSHIMDHLIQCNWLRDNWLEMIIRSDRALKRGLRQAGVLLVESGKDTFERTVDGQRVGHMVGLSLSALQANGVDSTKALQTVCDPVLL
jgi:hypothetical protein